MFLGDINNLNFRRFLLFLLFIIFLIIIYLLSDALNHFYQSVNDLRVIQLELISIKAEISSMKAEALAKRPQELAILKNISTIKIGVAVLIFCALYLLGVSGF